MVAIEHNEVGKYYHMIDTNWLAWLHIYVYPGWLWRQLQKQTVDHPENMPASRIWAIYPGGKQVPMSARTATMIIRSPEHRTA
jgi:hypothetical protein